MHNIATVPDLYPIIVDLNCVPSLLGSTCIIILNLILCLLIIIIVLGLLSHENTDIAVATVNLLQGKNKIPTYVYLWK
jgi:hypothetical protein